MNTGMLWFDNDPKATLEQKIQKAIGYFLKKYGRAPEFCRVNVVNAQNVDLATLSKSLGIIVKMMPLVVPNNFIIGYEQMDLEIPERAYAQ